MMTNTRVYLTFSKAGHWHGTVKRVWPNGRKQTIFFSEKCSTKEYAHREAREFIASLPENQGE